MSRCRSRNPKREAPPPRSPLICPMTRVGIAVQKQNAVGVLLDGAGITQVGKARCTHLYELADLFRVFGDSTRIKILYALHDSELCVQDIANAVQLSQSAVSHQLRVLKDCKLVRFRREGKTVYYALDDDHVRSILSMGMDHIEE